MGKTGQDVLGTPGIAGGISRVFRLAHPIRPRRLGPSHHMVAPPQDPPAAEVALPLLVHPERPIDAPSRELRQQEIRAETAVPDYHIPRLQGVEHLPEQGHLAGLLPLVGAHGQVANQARPEPDQDRQAGDREPQAWLLRPRLREGHLVLRRVGHRHPPDKLQLNQPPSSRRPAGLS